MYFAIKTYIAFLLHSTNQHAVHSPFIFNYITQGLYKKTDSPIVNGLGSNYSSYKTLYKTLDYFAIKKLWLYQPKPSLKAAISAFQISFTEIYDLNTLSHFNCLIVDALENLEFINKLFQLADNTSLLLVLNIHASNTNISHWNLLKQNANHHITVTTYNLGIVFFREAQAKQHFIIRTS